MEAGASSSSILATSAQSGAASFKQLACTPCRAAKVKCKLSEDHVSGNRGSQCLRCVQHRLQCEVPARKKRQMSVAHQASSHGHRISKNPHLPSTSSGLPQAYALPISPASRWSVGPSLAGLDPPAPANDPTATQVGGTQDFFSMYNTFEQPSSRPVSHYIRPVGGSSGIEIGMDPNEPSLFYTDANTARSNQSKGLHQSSGPSGSPNHPASRGRLASQPHGRPQGAMSVTQELQAVKDDLGIPTTRDVSRNASPEVREERGTAPGWSSPESSDFAGLAPGTCEPDVPGVLTAEDVAELFDKFFEFHNKCIGLLDPALHTPRFTISTSPLLFYAILAVTAEVFRSEQYTTLWLRAKSMIDQAFAVAEESVELCQAVSLVFQWNDVEDRSGSLRFGFAVRIAQHLGLHRTPRRPLPQNELAARLELNKERTWINLSGVDAVINGMYGGIPIISQPRSPADVEAWIADHPQYPCPSDIVLLVASSIAALIAVATSRQGGTPDILEGISGLERLRRAQVEWSLRWLGPRPPGGTLTRSFRAYLRWVEKGVLRDYTNVARLAATDEDRAECLWNDIHASIESIRELSSDLSTQSLLFWGTNSVALHASKCGMLLAKHIALLAQPVAKSIMAIFEDIHLASSLNVATGSRKEYLAKLFGSLLRISRRSIAVKPFTASGLDDGSVALPSRTETSDDIPRWHDDAPLASLQCGDDLEAQRLLEASIDDFVSQFSNNAGVAFFPGESVTSDDAWLVEYFSQQ